MSTLADRKAALLPQVRAAAPEDFPQIMELCRQLYAENGARNVKWGNVERVIINGINGRDGIIGVIGDVGKELGGMIYLKFSSMWYSEEEILEELFCFVPDRPDLRRGKNCRVLIQFAMLCSSRLKIPLLIGIISNTRTQAKIRLYRRLLGEPAGAFFLYGAKTGGR